jgi:diacylglycerol kinase family enzyme
LTIGFAAVRVLLLVNPAASSVTTRARVGVERILRDAFATDTVETTRRGHAVELTREAVREAYDVVAVLAGDGTLNEAGGGLAGSDVALAPLPGGSTNVFARTLGVAYAPEDAAHQLVASLRRGSQRRIGLGAAVAPTQTERHFLFHLGVGFDAAIIRRMEARSYLKRHFAHPAFAVATVDTWLRHYDRATRIRFLAATATGTATREDVSALGPYAVISNSDPYTYVGHRPLRIAPDASLDAALTVTVLTSLRLALVLRAAASAVGNIDFLATSPEIVQVPDVGRVSVSADAPFPWQVDGDYLGEVEQLEITHRPDCLTVVTP